MWKRCLYCVDSLRDRFQSGDVFCLVATALLIVNNRQTLSQSFSKIGNRLFHWTNYEWTGIDTNTFAKTFLN